VRLLPKPKPLNPANDDNLGRGMEFALTTLVFLGIGFALDAWWGTRPVMTIALTVFAFIGQLVRMWFVYDGVMRAHEAERAAARRSQHIPVASADPLSEARS
jgi:F0F1-type ATP synthase assembly protein I